MPQKYTYHLRILEHHLDAFGHVNHAVYLEILEEARWELITSGGWGLERILKEQQGPVILDANIRYARELKLRDEVRVVSELTDYRKSIGTVYQEIINQNDEICCKSEMRFGIMCFKTRKLLVPDAEWMYALGRREGVSKS